MKTRTFSTRTMTLLAVMYLAIIWFGNKRNWQHQYPDEHPVPAAGAEMTAHPAIAARQAASDNRGGNNAVSDAADKDLGQLVKNALRKTENRQRFIRNNGQIASSVKYYTDAANIKLAITGDKIRLVANNSAGKSNEDVKTHIVDVSFDGANELKPESVAGSIITYNYMQDENNIQTNVQGYGELLIPGIYDGVNLRLYSNENGAIEFDWLVNNPEDYKKIKMRFAGQDFLKKGKDGELTVGLRFDEIQFHIPESYQIVNNKKQPVEMQFNTTEETVSFSLSKNDVLVPDAPLVIDPTITSATFIAQDPSMMTSMDITAVARDAAGNVYAGLQGGPSIFTSAYINNAPGYDQGKLNTSTLGLAGCLVKITGNTCTGFTFFGNSTGVTALKLFPNGRILFSGYVNATGNAIPTTAGAYIGNPRPATSDYKGFIGVISADLQTLHYASYLPGLAGPIHNYNGQVGPSFLEILDDQTYFVGGATATAGVNYYYPAGFISAGAADASGDATYGECYIARFSGPGYNVHNWGTFLGGNGFDRLGGLKLTPDKSKLAFFGQTGSSQSWPAVTANNVGTGSVGSNFFLGTLNPGSSVPSSFQFLSFLGGVSSGMLLQPKLDVSNNFFYLAYTINGSAPGTSAVPAVYDATINGGYDVVLSKVPIDGTTSGIPIRSTYLGGSGADFSNVGIAVNESLNKLYVVGSTSYSASFPLLNPSGSGFFDNTFGGGGSDFFISVLSADLTQLTYSTYLGGDGIEAGSCGFSTTFWMTSSNTQLMYNAATDNLCVGGVSNPFYQNGTTNGHGPIFGPNSFDPQVTNGSKVPFVFNFDGGGNPPCTVVGGAVPALSSNSISNNCPATTADLNSLHTGVAPPGTTLVWFTNNSHSGAQYATPGTAGPGTYYAFYYDPVNACYGSPSAPVTVFINPCPCTAGSTAPSLSSNNASNVCPVTTVNLNSLHTGVTPPGATLVWFTNSTHSGAQYATPTTAGVGTYYAFYFDVVNNCYSPAASPVLVTTTPCTCSAGSTAPVLSSNNVTNSCPQTTFDLNSLVVGVPPAGTTVVWYTNNSHTGAAYATPNAATDGVYYAFFLDPVNDCFSPASTAVTVTSTSCAPDLTPTVDIDDLNFAPGSGRDFVLNIFEIANNNTDPAQPVLLRLTRPSGWDITVPGIAVLTNSLQSGFDGISDVLGGTPNQNSLWQFRLSGSFIEISLQPGLIIPANSSMQIGLRATRKTGTPLFTFQNITAIITDGAGGDISPQNNSSVTTITAGN
ncbi:MAG: hypothetical protein JNM88_14790 [Chitinophagaceae bacterium]|nr:hypothetical protein [Chitinophagaceae bacterium]